MKIITILSSATFCLAVLVPGVVSAFEVTDTSAYQLTETTSLFTITYEFGYLNGVAQLPILPTYGSTIHTNQTHLSYELSDQSGEVLPANYNTVGVVLSGANINNNYYQIEAGDRQTFTLLVIHNQTGETPDTLSVTSFGHRAEVNEEVKYLEVSDEQLLDYQVTLN